MKNYICINGKKVELTKKQKVLLGIKEEFISGEYYDGKDGLIVRCIRNRIDRVFHAEVIRGGDSGYKKGHISECWVKQLFTHLPDYVEENENLELISKSDSAKVFNTSQVEVGKQFAPKELERRCLIVRRGYKVIVEDNKESDFPQLIRFVKI